jgi:hypothetical protein
MDVARRAPWPRFELVPLSGEGLPAAWAARYPLIHVPGSTGVGACNPVALTLVATPDAQDLVRFAGDRFGALCLDDDGRVLSLITDADGRLLREPSLVNTSLERHVATVQAATARFPFDDGLSDEDLELVADELRSHLEPIDREAWYPDGYWDKFYWHVTIGDYWSALFERP